MTLTISANFGFQGFADYKISLNNNGLFVFNKNCTLVDGAPCSA